MIAGDCTHTNMYASIWKSVAYLVCSLSSYLEMLWSVNTFHLHDWLCREDISNISFIENCIFLIPISPEWSKWYWECIFSYNGLPATWTNDGSLRRLIYAELCFAKLTAAVILKTVLKCSIKHNWISRWWQLDWHRTASTIGHGTNSINV